jgi:hypothetical protein
MPARIVQARDGEVRADFSELSESCQQALEKHVFQRHRRSVHDRRSLQRQS